MSISPGIIIFSDNPFIRLGRHLILFFSMVLVFTWVISRRDTDAGFISVLPAVSLNALFFFGYAYLTAFILVPGLLLERKYLLFIVLFLASGFIISWLKFLFSDILFYSAIADDLADKVSRFSFQQLLVNTKDMTFIVAIFIVARYARDNYYIKLRLQKLNAFEKQEEIMLLKNQMDPHVVFNHLNNLYSLAINHAVSLPTELKRFRSVLQYYFETGKESRVNLDEELKIIQDFIALEKLRYGDRLKVDFRIEGNTEGKLIVPFVLFRFIEICFEHGLNPDSGEAWIKVSVKSEGDRLYYHISNSKPSNLAESENISQIILSSVKPKLDLHYTGRYNLKVVDGENMFLAKLKINLHHGPGR